MRLNRRQIRSPISQICVARWRSPTLRHTGTRKRQSTGIQRTTWTLANKMARQIRCAAAKACQHAEGRPGEKQTGRRTRPGNLHSTSVDCGTCGKAVCGEACATACQVLAIAEIVRLLQEAVLSTTWVMPVLKTGHAQKSHVVCIQERHQRETAEESRRRRGDRVQAARAAAAATAKPWRRTAPTTCPTCPAAGRWWDAGWTSSAP